jgi:3-oxoacyl-[acyl-carrier protein] reductase
MDLGLESKTVFIAGSTRGIGLAIARGFLREGASVVITGRTMESLEKAKAMLVTEADENRILAIKGDMTVPSDIHRAIEESIEIFGKVYCVIANVGSGVGRAGWDLGIEDWQSGLQVNLYGAIFLVQVVMDHLIKQGEGSMIFISSIAGCEALSAPLPYSAAKAALINITKNLSRMVGPHGIRVNAVAPGNVLFPGGSWEKKLNENREFFEDYIRREVPLQRFGRAEEVADAVVYLASKRASFVTGACVVLDGGQTRSY